MDDDFKHHNIWRSEMISLSIDDNGEYINDYAENIDIGHFNGAHETKKKYPRKMDKHAQCQNKIR